MQKSNGNVYETAPFIGVFCNFTPQITQDYA